MTTFTEKFYDITHLIQQEFSRNLTKHGDKIQCRKGCSQCCSQIFRITLADAYIIKKYVESLSKEEQTLLKQKAKSYAEKIREVGTDDEFSLTPKIPCPALGDEGECTMYESRPVICRRFGMPMYDYKNPGKVYACELNFKPGEEINDSELVQNQTQIGIKWDELKDEFNSSSGITPGGKTFTTIAKAILEA